MRKSKFSETQIVGILKDAESGVPVADPLRKYGVSKATFFKWRSKYGGASMSDVKRLRELEAENAKLKRMRPRTNIRTDQHQDNRDLVELDRSLDLLLDSPSLCVASALLPMRRREAILAGNGRVSSDARNH